jgi:hypothetical protein
MVLHDCASYNDDIVLLLTLNVREIRTKFAVVCNASVAATMIPTRGGYTWHDTNIGSPIGKRTEKPKLIRIKDIHTISLQSPIRYLQPRPKRPS